MQQYNNDPVILDPDRLEKLNYDRLKEQIMSRYNLMEERIIVQQSEIARLNREIARLKNYVDELQQQMRRRG
jgi:hypothetical protein